MAKESYEARKQRMRDRRSVRVLFQPMRLGNHWYVVRWPDGTVLVGPKSESEARELAHNYGAARVAA